MNINTELFKRYAPSKKLDIVNKLTESELLSVTTQTVARIIREAGVNRDRNKQRDPNKRLYIPRDLQADNNWNSNVVEVSIYKKKVWIDFYVQYGDHDTDGDFIESWDNFSKSGDLRGEIKGKDYYGNTKYYYYRYNLVEKAQVIKSILLTYLYTKYKDKLCTE